MLAPGAVPAVPEATVEHAIRVCVPRARRCGKEGGDERISYAALGILARALASSEGANRGYRAFVGRSLGEKAVRAAMRELEAVGYRFRFTLRKSSGRVRTLTIFSDKPLIPQQARAVALGQARGGDFLVEGLASPAPEPTDERDRLRRSHRAATGAARSDQGKRGKSPGRTVPRSTAGRSTVSRSSAALSLRDTKSSKEDLTLPHPHPPQEWEGATAPGAGPGPVGPGTGAGVAGGVAASAAHSIDPAKASLIVECLPAPMQVLDAVGARQVVDLLAERVEAGWTPTQIRELLDQPLPLRVHRMAGLVASRLRDNVAVDQAPRRLEAAAARRRAERERQRLEALEAQAEMETVDPVFEAVWERVKAEMPDAGYTVWAFEARERLKSYDLDAASSQ